MNTIDRMVNLELPDNPGHKLCFTIKSITECEKELINHNLILTIAGMAAAPLAVGDVFTLLKWGLLGSGKYSQDEVEIIFMECVDELGLVGLQEKIVLALEKSGVIGKVKNKAALPKEKKKK